MKYLIMCRSEKGTEKIAEFKNKYDQEICLIALREEYTGAELFAATGS